MGEQCGYVKNRTSTVMLLNRTGGVVWALKPKYKTGRGLGPGNIDFLGLKWHSPIGSMPFHRAQKGLDFPLTLALIISNVKTTIFQDRKLPFCCFRSKKDRM